MKEVRINTARPYSVYIEDGGVEGLGESLKGHYAGCKIAVITDSNVDKLYGDAVMSSLISADFRAVKYAFKAGEGSKNITTYGSILNFLAQNAITRSDIILAVGGGVVGDLAGFAAGTYMRGIKYIQVPTTLLACVDSSVGGKSGIDLASGKNLAGVFHQPEGVYAFTAVLETLPEDYTVDGMGEVVKYAVLCGGRCYNMMCADNWRWSQLVEICVEIKGEIVAKDEFDVAERRLLNLGHTFGHAIEKLSDYKVSHGVAVAVGIKHALELSQKLGILEDDYTIIRQLLDRLNTPRLGYTLADMLPHMALDKKVWQGKINLVLIKRLGECVVQEVEYSLLQSIASGTSREDSHWI